MYVSFSLMYIIIKITKSDHTLIFSTDVFIPLKYG